jgi:4-hydroxy-3-polyprenylbenzoate decarboxylase
MSNPPISRDPAAPNRPGRVTLAITGASGAAYGLRLIQTLLEANTQVYLMISDAGRIVLATEVGLKLPRRGRDMERALLERLAAGPGLLRVFGLQDWNAPIASGSNPADAMVVCPCTTGALAAIACGASDNLIERAADVMIKEGRPLLLVPRETPFSVLHLENMLRLARMGVVILPPNPGFYHHPRGIDDLVDFVVARILDRLGVPHHLMAPWGEAPHD